MSVNYLLKIEFEWFIRSCSEWEMLVYDKLVSSKWFQWVCSLVCIRIQTRSCTLKNVDNLTCISEHGIEPQVVGHL